jgi:hypothetical protein
MIILFQASIGATAAKGKKVRRGNYAKQSEVLFLWAKRGQLVTWITTTVSL